MNLQRRIRKLNQSFLKFGLNPYGELIYQWKHTTDMNYLIEIGEKVGDWERNSAGILLRKWEPTYDRHTWADTPHGQKWIMAKWQPPMSESEWLLRVGRCSPWPVRGQFHPIENMGVHDGGCTCKDITGPPDERHTEAAVSALEYHLGKTQQELLERLLIRQTLQRKAERNRIYDEIDDVMTAFGRVPGSNDGSTSIMNEATRKAEKAGLPVNLERKVNASTEAVV